MGLLLGRDKSTQACGQLNVTYNIGNNHMTIDMPWSKERGKGESPASASRILMTVFSVSSGLRYIWMMESWRYRLDAFQNTIPTIHKSHFCDLRVLAEKGNPMVIIHRRDRCGQVWISPAAGSWDCRPSSACPSKQKLQHSQTHAPSLH
jgi:hypothetical protein